MLKRHKITVVRDLTHVQLMIQKLKVLLKRLFMIIIQQIVTMPIYGKEALNICHPT